MKCVQLYTPWSEYIPKLGSWSLIRPLFNMSDLSFSLLNECTIAFDLHTRKVIFASPNTESILGYKPSCFFGNSSLLFDMVEEGFRKNFDKKLGHLGKNEQLQLYYQVNTPVGDKLWVCDRKSITEGAEDGQEILLSIFTGHNPGTADTGNEALVREQFLNSLIDSQTNFLIRFDTNGVFTFANKQFLRLLGYKRSELIGKHFSAVTVPGETEMCMEAFACALKNPGKAMPLAHKKRDKAGNILETEWEFVSVTNDEGAVIAIQGIGQDVSYRRMTEKAAKAVAEKLDQFIESINDYFFVLDEDWRFIRVNAAFEMVTQKSRIEMLGQTIWEVFPITVDSIFEEVYRKAAIDKIPVQFIGHVESSQMWFNTSVYPSAEGLTVFMQDISEEKRAQEESARTKNSLEALINNTEDQIWSVDSEMRYVYMNKAYRNQIARFTGHEPVHGEFSYHHKGYTAEEIEEWNEHYQRALAGERYMMISEVIDPLNGKLMSFQVSFNPIYKVKGQITGVGCFARDITQWLASEKAIVDQNDRLRHIASLTSHELRRPVASMLGLINLMDRANFFNPDNKEIIEHLLTVGNEIDEVIRLIVDRTVLGDTARTEKVVDKYQVP